MTLNSYSSLCDDFFLDMHVNTELDLPSQRDTVLTFFERIRKQYPTMGRFFRRDSNEYCLEEDRSIGQYCWVTLETDRLGCGVVNPSDFEVAYRLDKFVLELMPYMLGVSPLDVDSLDITMSMDFDCHGNHDEVIAESLFAASAIGNMLDIPTAKPIGFSPSIILSLSDDQFTQARISIESKTSVFEPEIKRLQNEEAISLSLTIRQYPKSGEVFDPIKSFNYQSKLAQEIMDEKIVPFFVQPLTEVIAQRRSG
jgi:hypothetical protein